MAIEGKPRRDAERGFVWRITSGPNGLSGVRNYEVNTDIEELALYAAGIPADGDPWSTTDPLLNNLLLKERTVERIAGRDADGTGSGGLSRVELKYATPGAGAFASAPVGKAWTELKASSQSITAKYPRVRMARTGYIPGPDPAPPPNSSVLPPYAQIQGGDGASVLVGGLEARVHAYVPLGQPYDLGRLVPLMRPSKLNNGAITLPRLGGIANWSWDVAEGLALYTAFEGPTISGRFIEIVHVLQLAEDWRHLWQPEDEKGRGFNILYFDTVYERASFAGLW